MAITAIQLDNWAERTLVNGFQMNSMVQLDGAWSRTPSRMAANCGWPSSKLRILLFT